MKISYIKDMLRGLRRDKGKFIAIVGIVALGAGFFGGIKASSVDMKLTADKYYKENSMMDFKAVSTLGLTDDDVSALAELPSVERAEPSYQYDTVIKGSGDDGAAMVARVHSYDENASLNRCTLVSGRFPESKNECVLVDGLMFGISYKLGDVLEIDFEADPDSEDNLAVKSFTVVGFVNNSMYMSFDRAASNKGTGTVSAYIYAPAEAFDIEAYTEIYMSMKDADKYSAFSDEYKSLLEQGKAEIKAIGPQRNEERYNSVVGEAQEKLDDARADFEKEKADAEVKLADGKKQIDDADKEIADAEKKLADGKKDLEQGIDDYNSGLDELSDGEHDLSEEMKKAEQEFADARAEIKEAQDVIDQGRSQLSQGEGQLSEARSALEGKQSELDAQKAQIDLMPDGPPKDYALAQIAAGQAQLDAGFSQLSSAQAEINEGGAQLLAGQRQADAATRELNEKYADYEKEIADARKELDDGWAELADAEKTMADAKVTIADGENDLAEGKQKLADAKIEYEDKKAEADEQIADAEVKLDDAQTEINDIESPDWYAYTKKDIQSFTSFDQDADRIDAVATLFPIFFFLVAALVCLTTMTRIVEDDRNQIGILKALGYSKFTISAKYVVLAAMMSIVGSIIGLTIGFQVFPKVVWAAYGIMYVTPPLLTPWNFGYGAAAVAIFLVCTVGSTLFACIEELSSVPADLIRPKPPKSGKRILLERISAVWKRLSFTTKLTARNIFRYKKRFLMTVVGIAGCTALMLTGFGVKDSIQGIVDNQYDRIVHHDAQLGIAHGIDFSNITKRQQELIAAIESDENVKSYNIAHQQALKAVSKKSGENLDVYMYVPHDVSTVTDFITFQTMSGHTPIEFPSEGAIITQKLSNETKCVAGDMIAFTDNDGKEFEVMVTGVSENYVYNYVYMPPQEYERIYGEPCEYQLLSFILNDVSSAAENEFSSRMLENSEAITMFFSSDLRDNLSDTLASLNLVVVVLIVSASLLAFVVLYNLTNINISERVREIATIKVLGFYNREVDSYIYRENIALTLIGILVGFGFGVYMHKYVMRVAEVNVVMFGRNIAPISFLYAALLTVAFSLVVNFAVHFKLKKINMVESLKSVE